MYFNFLKKKEKKKKGNGNPPSPTTNTIEYDIALEEKEAYSLPGVQYCYSRPREREKSWGGKEGGDCSLPSGRKNFKSLVGRLKGRRGGSVWVFM